MLWRALCNGRLWRSAMPAWPQLCENNECKVLQLEELGISRHIKQKSQRRRADGQHAEDAVA